MATSKALTFSSAEGVTLFQDVTGISSLLVVYDSPAQTRLVGDGDVMADVFKLG